MCRWRSSTGCADCSAADRPSARRPFRSEPRRDVAARGEHHARAGGRRPLQQRRRRRGARRLGDHLLARVEQVDRRHHLLLADRHHVVHQIADRCDVERERTADRQAVRDRVARRRFHDLALFHDSR